MIWAAEFSLVGAERVCSDFALATHAMCLRSLLVQQHCMNSYIFCTFSSVNPCIIHTLILYVNS